MSIENSIVSDYAAVQPKIDIAAQKIEKYQEDFAKIVVDPDKLFNLAKQVFGDDRFKDFRYTGKDIQRSLEALGYPQVGVVPPLSFADIAELCTRYLIEPEKRFDLSRHLLMVLPALVDQNKNMEAILVLNTAYRMVEAPTKVNLFLLEMFRFGWNEWESEMTARRKAFLSELGTEAAKMSELSLEEAEELAIKLITDPEKKARLMAFYAANPTLRQHDAAEILQMEHSAVLLLVSDEAGPLHLPASEVKPWLTEELIGKLQPLGAKARAAFAAGEQEKFDVFQEKITDIMIETAMDMAIKLFTPQRRLKMVEDLKSYRHNLLEVGRITEFRYVQGALLALSNEDIPSGNPLLVTICFESLRRAYAANF